MKRLAVDILLLVAIGIMLFAVPMEIAKPGLELFLFKALLISAGFLHAHIVRKLAFPKVNWKSKEEPYLKVLVIALYAVIIFSYARGG